MPWIETDNGLWWLPDELCEQIRTARAGDAMCGLPVVWQADRQEQVDYTVNRDERRRRKRGRNGST